jgi:hypothetical protein
MTGVTTPAPEPGTPWVSDVVTVAASPIEGRGLHATEDMAAGTIVIRLAGRLVSSHELARIMSRVEAEPDAVYVDTITVDEDRHLVMAPGSLVHFGNHSCDPNCWHVGPYAIATRRAVRRGQELTIDYATSSGAGGFSMRCRCGSSLCRGEVSSDDWRRPELQDRYRGHWVPALEERIRSTGTE